MLFLIRKWLKIYSISNLNGSGSLKLNQGRVRPSRDAEHGNFPGQYNFIIIIKEFIADIVQNTQKWLNTTFFLKWFILYPPSSDHVKKYQNFYFYLELSCPNQKCKFVDINYWLIVEILGVIHFERKTIRHVTSLIRCQKGYSLYHIGHII